MADGTGGTDREDDGPSLELPSFGLGLGRRRRKEPRGSTPPEVPASPDPGPEVPSGPAPEVPASPDPGPEVPAQPDPGPEVTPGTEPDVPAPRPGPGPGGEPPSEPEIDPGGPERPSPLPQEPEIDPLLPGGPPPPPAGPEIDPLIPTRPEEEPGPWSEPPAPEADPEPAPAPLPGPEPEPDPEPETRPGPFDPDPVAPPPDGGSDATRGASSQRAGTSVATQPATLATHASVRPDEADGPRTPRELRFPSLPPLPAVLLVGLVVGLAAVLLTYGSLRLCDAATGTASCGGGPGLLMLLAIVITLTYLGGWLLRGFGIDDAGSTSFLAVGLVTLVAMLFLLDSLDERSGVVAVPAVAVLAYALSWRVTAVLVEANADQD
ncbi:hypothetical protein [Nocardioides sediminis]|uniref:hypothetical protein n=1 Tax=Nocardioides sediminis TaxID=433648 RepID=UPI000D32394B|nr:hypothetical protein [Nocardioides sediminis]